MYGLPITPVWVPCRSISTLSCLNLHEWHKGVKIYIDPWRIKNASPRQSASFHTHLMLLVTMALARVTTVIITLNAGDLRNFWQNSGAHPRCRFSYTVTNFQALWFPSKTYIS